VHEAYLRLAARARPQWQSRQHFFAVAAQVMRRILVDHARRRRATKRGGSDATVVLDETVHSPRGELDLLALDDALHALAKLDPRQSQIVELRFFAGLSIEETSQALGISHATVKRDWTTARAWLLREMSK
jgi:RNA polymerase sigma factor (TIGR02999 family)